MFILAPYRDSCQGAILSTGIINKSICGWLCTFSPYAVVLGRCHFAHEHSKGKLERDTWIPEVQSLATCQDEIINLDFNQKAKVSKPSS